MKNKSFLKGALILTLTGIIAKIFGAVYRIPLTNLLGAEGMGVYQLVFPLYSLLLMLSSAGVPAGLSKMIAEDSVTGGKRTKKIFLSAMRMLLISGFIAAIFIFTFSSVIAKLQGNPNAALPYKLLAPALIFVSITSVFRGYFQGYQSMIQSGMSQVFEQIVKLVAGLYLAYKFIPFGVAYGAAGAILGITISEFASMLTLTINYFTFKEGREERKLKTRADMKTAMEILKISFPVTLCAMVIPVTQLIDSAVVVNLLSAINGITQATKDYGLFTGPVNSLINLPTVLTMSVSLAVLPSLSRSFAEKNLKDAERKTRMSVKLTLMIALPSLVGLLLLAKPITDLLYGGLESEELSQIYTLLKISCIGVVFISLIQTFSAIMQALGKPYFPVISMASSGALKIILNVIMIKSGAGIFGVALGNVICYGVCMLMNLIFLTKYVKLYNDIYSTAVAPLLSSVIMGAGIFAFNGIFNMFLPQSVSLLIVIIIGILLYLAALILSGGLKSKDFATLPLPKFMKKILCSENANENNCSGNGV